MKLLLAALAAPLLACAPPPLPGLGWSDAASAVLAVRLRSGDLMWVAQDLGEPFRLDLGHTSLGPGDPVFALGFPEPLGTYYLEAGTLSAGEASDPALEPQATHRARLDARAWIDTPSAALPPDLLSFRPARHLPEIPDICGRRRVELLREEVLSFSVADNGQAYVGTSSRTVERVVRSGEEIQFTEEPELSAIERSVAPIAVMGARTAGGSFWLVRRNGAIRHWPGPAVPMATSTLAATAVDIASEDLSTLWLTTAEGALLLVTEGSVRLISAAAVAPATTIPRVIAVGHEAFAIQVGAREAVTHARLDGTYAEETLPWPVDRPAHQLTALGAVASGAVYAAGMVSADGSPMRASTVIFQRQRDGSWQRLGFELSVIVATLADLDGVNMGYGGWSQATLVSISGNMGSFGPNGQVLSCGLGTGTFTQLATSVGGDLVLSRIGDPFGVRRYPLIWIYPPGF